MLRRSPVRSPRRILMTVDAIGGVWRYALDTAQTLAAHGVECVLVGLGPRPTAYQRREVSALKRVELVWIDAPLDWMIEKETQLHSIPESLARIAEDDQVDLLHLNAPTQAVGLKCLPIAVASHSCVITWWRALREGPLPESWNWQYARNRRGLESAALVLAPSRSHADAIRAAYEVRTPIQVVHNATLGAQGGPIKEPFVFSAARWWDEAKNGALVDAVAGMIRWPLVLAGSLEGPNGQRFQPTHAVATGPLTTPQVRHMMAKAMIFVGPSRYEPFGLAVLEAASAGSALVLSDIPTFRELWQDVAVFCPADDKAAFAAAVARLMTDRCLRLRLSEAARLRANQFSLDRHVEQLLQAYSEILSTGAAAPAYAA
jgi:glycosyltransferase involved in cell wall biosynthesis